MSTFERRPLRSRVLLASFMAIVGAVVFRLSIHGGEPTVYIPVVATALGALVIHFRALGAQLLGRALFWSNFVLGSFLCFLGSSSDESASIGLLVGCGLALLLAERRALAEAADARGFRPASFAGTIELLMVLALADAQTCLLLGLLSKTHHAELLLIAAVGLIVGFVGLYRLVLWGVVVTMSTATALSLTMLSGIFGMNDAQVPFGLLFGLQVLAPLPMLYSLATKRALPQPNPRLRSLAASVLVGVVMIVSLTAAFRHHW
jgi:hypothetical protein